VATNVEILVFFMQLLFVSVPMIDEVKAIHVNESRQYPAVMQEHINTSTSPAALI